MFALRAEYKPSPKPESFLRSAIRFRSILFHLFRSVEGDQIASHPLPAPGFGGVIERPPSCRSMSQATATGGDQLCPLS